MSLSSDILTLTKPLTVLYVEDEKESRDMVHNGILRHLFSRVHCAEDGDKGIDLFKKNQCDLIITDLNMPNKNGIEMIREIREVDSEIPIIILSAHSDISYFLNSIELGVDGYILKPIREQNILSVIKKCAKQIADKKELEFRRKAELEKKDLVIYYQKNKIITYKSLLEELLILKHFNKTITKDASKNSDYIKSDAILNGDEIELLRKRRVQKVSAIEYVDDLNDDILEEIFTLEEVEKDIADSVSDFLETRKKEHLYSITRLLDEYARNIKLLIEFEDLACAINSLVSFLENFPEDKINDNGTKINIYLSNIFSDLKEWRKKIFVTKDTQDIHYLDSSLFSSSLQMQLSLSQNMIPDEDGNDLELF